MKKYFEPAVLGALALGLILGSTVVYAAHLQAPAEKVYIPVSVPVITQAVALETPQPPTPAPRSAPDVAVEDLTLMAIALYREAGGDACCDECRYRVGDVILNRVKDPRFPDTIAGVLTQPGQYAGDVTAWPARADNPGERAAVKRAWETAARLLSDEHHSDLYGQGYIYQSTQPGLGSSEGRVKCCGQYFAKG